MQSTAGARQDIKITQFNRTVKINAAQLLQRVAWSIRSFETSTSSEISSGSPSTDLLAVAD